MSTVTLTIGPKSYAVACADGEEAHITALGAIIAEKYAQLGGARAPLEAQNLLFAALFLADELAEARKQIKSGSAGSPAPASETDPEAIAALRAAIAELEDDLAAALTGAAEERLAEAVANGHIDADEAAEIQAELADRIQDRLDGIRPERSGRGHQPRPGADDDAVAEDGES